MTTWRFISNHGVVIVYISKRPDVTATHIAAAIGIQERTVRRIIADLVADGYLEKERIGRSNRYKVNVEAPLRRPILRHSKVGRMLETLVPLLEIDE
jgi:predicted HTH transcriptional regulator